MRDALALFQNLEKEAHKYDFFQLLRLLENAFPDQPRLGKSLRPRDEAVRFSQNPEFAFQATAIASFQTDQGNVKARLAVNFFGLTGPHGPLPTHLTEYVRDRQRNAGDPTLVRFLDIFHHRLLSLFYRARASAEPAIQLDREDDDRFTAYVGSLFGLGTDALQRRDAVPDFGKLHFAGLLAQRVRNASGLVTILNNYFQLPVRVEQFVGHWMQLPAETQTRLGALDGSCTLGGGAVLGTQVWDSQSKFRLVIGPLSEQDYIRFLPGGDSITSLIDWVRNYCGESLEWDVRLILKKDHITPTMIGKSRLGYTSRIRSCTPTRDAHDFIYNPGETARRRSQYS